MINFSFCGGTVIAIWLGHHHIDTATCAAHHHEFSVKTNHLPLLQKKLCSSSTCVGTDGTMDFLQQHFAAQHEIGGNLKERGAELPVCSLFRFSYCEPVLNVVSPNRKRTEKKNG